MTRHKTLLAVGIFMLFAGFYYLNSSKAYADTLGQVTKTYTIPTSNSYPYGITEGPDGNIWFTENSGNKIGRITMGCTPGSGSCFYEWTLPYSYSGPVNIVNGPDNALWFAEETKDQIGKITTDGTITQYPLPSGSQPTDLVLGPDGDLWINSYSSNKVYRMTASGSYTTYTLNNSSAYGIYLASDPLHDEVWVGERNGGTGGWITKFDMNGNQTDYTLPSGMINISSMIQGNDGDIYFTVGGPIGHYYIDKIDDTGNFATPIDLGGGHSLWTIRVGLDGYVWATDYTGGKMARVDSGLNITEYSSGLSYPIGLASGTDGNMWFTQYTGNTISTIGEGSYTDVDADGDGLTASQELLQGTSDLVADTNHDGISDFIGSPWDPNREAEFCNADGSNCAYPDPLKQNIYVDIDWMVAPGGTSYEPSNTQLTAIQEVYLAHGIDFHYDTGNFGDGKQVPYNASIYFSSSDGHPSLLDYKYGGDGIPAEFDNANRAGIWRYVLFGYGYEEHPTSSGVSTAGGPDVFISDGYIKDNQLGFGYSSFDTAVEGTLFHELGHTSCLTNPNLSTYTGQPLVCQYDGIDGSSYSQYHSVMNYLYQMTMLNYSSGQNDNGGDSDPTAVDHNDWAAFDPGAFNVGGEGGIEGVSILTRRTHDEWLHEHRAAKAASLGQTLKVKGIR